MIIRKPYAFLIKNFRKIHIFLLLLSLFVAYKLFGVSGFVNEFMKFGTYDIFGNPITNYITFLLQLSILILVVGSTALLFLLKHKNKPWKLYLIPIIEYFLLFLVLGMIKSFFKGFTDDVATTDLRLSRDLLMIFVFAQLPAIGIYAMRVFGIDFKKFNFNSDQEFLELSEADREEIEIGFDIDKNSFIRFYRKILRNVNYFYMEHTRICKFFIGLFIVFLVFNVYKFIFVTNRVYSQGHNYNVNGYTIKVNNSYFTDKSCNGEIISKNENFIILDITVTNHSAPRNFKTENFHLKSGSHDYVTTRKLYAKEFNDLGVTYENVKEMKRDESFRFIEIYKVDKKLRRGSFVLYYQEGNGNLRKIKLKLKDISKIEDSGEIELGDDITFNYNNSEETISLNSYSISNKGEYTIQTCITTGCYNSNKTYNYTDGKMVLRIGFGSTNFEGKDMVDFSSNYGKIVYIDNENSEEVVGFKYPFVKTAKGKYIYTLVPDDIKDASVIKVIYTIRNKQYTYILKKENKNENMEE